MYVISYGGKSSHNMQLTEFGIPTSINIWRYAPDTIILEMRSEVTVTVIWICYVTLHHPKMHPHAKFMIPTLNNIEDMLRTRIILETKSKSQWPQMHPHTKFGIPTSNNVRDMLRTLLF